MLVRSVCTGAGMPCEFQNYAHDPGCRILGSRMRAAPSAVLCLEKLKLIKAFEWSVSEYNRMNTAQIAAVRNGEGFLFGEQVAEAGRAKERAKYAILKHEEEHGC